MENLKIKLNKIKEKPMLIFGISGFAIFVLSAFLIYFVRIVYFPDWLEQVQGTLVLFAVLASISLCVLGIKKLSKGNTTIFMTGLIFISGVVFCFVNPPNQVPDEQTHFLRSYAMAMGDFDFDENQQWPNDVNLLIKHFPVAHNNGYPAKVGNTMYNRFTEYFFAVEENVQGENHGIIIFQTLPYIPQAIGIFIARIFGIGALGAYYFGRIGNLIFYCVCCFFALKTAKKFNIILFLIMIMPLTIFLAASNSNDSMLLGLMFCVFATVLAEKFDAKMAAVFVVTMAILCTSKMSFIVMFPLLLCISKDDWDIKLKKWQFALIAIAAFLTLYQGMAFYVALASNYGEIPRTMVDSDPTRQLIFVLQNPLRYIVIFLDTLRNNSFFLFSGGLLGWLDVDLKLISYFTPLVMVFGAFQNAHKLEKTDAVRVWTFFAVSVLSYAVVLTGIYITWTPVTLPQIIGLQMRYLMPAFMGIIMLIAFYFSESMQPHRNSTLAIPTVQTGVVSNKAKTGGTRINAMVGKEKLVAYVGFCFCLLAAVLLFATYYLPIKVIVYVS